MINAAVSHWMARRGRSWRRLAGELATMLVVNLVIVLALEALDRFLGVRSARTPFGMTLFFSAVPGFTIWAVHHMRRRRAQAP